MRFEKDYLSSGYADKANYPSVNSCLPRSGSFKLKGLDKGLSIEESKIKIVQVWDGQRPPIKYMIGSFYTHLKSEKMEEDQGLQSGYSSHNGNQETS